MNQLGIETNFSDDENLVFISAPGPQGPPGPYAASVAYADVSGSVSTPYGIPTRWYGSFYDTTTQTASATNSMHFMRFNTSDSASTTGVRVNSSSIIFDHNGIYNIQFSAQFDTTKSSQVEVWIRKNGDNVPWSNTTVSTDNQNPRVAVAWNFIANVNSGDWMQLAWATSDIATRILSTASTSHSPEIPSIILTVVQV